MLQHGTRHGLSIVFFGLCMMFAPGSAIPDVCKWVDEDGCVHYAETCPEGVEGSDVSLEPPPSRQRTEAAERRSAETRQAIETRRQSKPADQQAQPHRGRSLPLDKLGELPENSVSRYLVTLGADYSFKPGTLEGRFVLRLEARDDLPADAWLEAVFPDPAYAEHERIVTKQLSGRGGDFWLYSPWSDGFKCWNYEIEVHVYRDRTKSELLGVHRQRLQSRIDLGMIQSAADLVTAMARGGRCPSVYGRELQNMSVDELEALCEREREKRLKPEREHLVERCIRRGDKQAEWCRNYYADWGDARRVDINTLLPPRYYDLPECVAARKAREEARR